MLSRYSGGGYVVLRTLVSDVTHSPFPELMERLVLRPAGMTHSTFRQPLLQELQASAATAYQSDGHAFEGRFHIYPEMAPDGLWTTASDLARFAIEVQNELAGASNKILSQATAREMLTRQMGSFGLGFRVGSTGGKPYFEHDGANFGFFSEMFAFSDSGGEGIIVLINGNNINLRTEFVRAVAREYHWSGFDPEKHVVAQNVPAETLAAYAGTYEHPEVGTIVVSFRNNKLFIDASGMRIEAEEMFPESENRFFIQPSSSTFVFKKNANGKVTSLSIEQHMSGALEAKKVS
jgi:CubicO group peptidase (beta-lactamase class C family)